LQLRDIFLDQQRISGDHYSAPRLKHITSAEQMPGTPGWYSFRSGQFHPHAVRLDSFELVSFTSK
jgi:hypothetical protein